MSSDFWYIVTLFTKYYILNPQYSKQIYSLRDNAEHYARTNLKNAIYTLWQTSSALKKQLDTGGDGVPYNKIMYHTTLCYIIMRLFENKLPIATLFADASISNKLLQVKLYTRTAPSPSGYYICHMLCDQIEHFYNSLPEAPLNLTLDEYTQKIVNELLQKYEESLYGYSNKA